MTTSIHWNIIYHIKQTFAMLFKTFYNFHIVQKKIDILIYLKLDFTNALFLDLNSFKKHLSSSYTT